MNTLSLHFMRKRLHHLRLVGGYGLKRKAMKKIKVPVLAPSLVVLIERKEECERDIRRLKKGKHKKEKDKVISLDMQLEKVKKLISSVMGFEETCLGDNF